MLSEASPVEVMTVALVTTRVRLFEVRFPLPWQVAPRFAVIAKVYVRRPADYPLIAARVREAMPRTQTMFLHAEICREDLLVEIDGVARVSS